MRASSVSLATRVQAVFGGLVLGASLALSPATGAQAQPPREGVDVGESSRLAQLVPAADVEKSANQQYHQLLKQAADKHALAPPTHPQLQRLKAISERLIPQALPWNERARG